MNLIPRKTSYKYHFRNKIKRKCALKRTQLTLHNEGLKQVKSWLPLTEYRKVLKEQSNDYGLFGRYVVLIVSHCKLKLNYMERLQLDIVKALKKKRCWLRICCDTPVTARPAETRMGKGKGNINFWEAKVTIGRVLVEFQGLTCLEAKNLVKTLNKKAPCELKLLINKQN